MAIRSAELIFDEMNNKKISNIVSKNEFNTFFKYIKKNGIITIFTANSYLNNILSFNMILDMLKLENRILYLSNNYNGEDIINYLLSIESGISKDDIINHKIIKSKNKYLNAQELILNSALFIDVSYSVLIKINDIEESLKRFLNGEGLKYNNKKINGEAKNNIVFLDFCHNDIDYKEIIYLSKKYNVIFVILKEFKDEIIRKLYEESNMIFDNEYYVNLLENNYNDALYYSNTLMIFNNEEIDMCDIKGTYKLSLISIDGIITNNDEPYLFEYEITSNHKKIVLKNKFCYGEKEEE